MKIQINWPSSWEEILPKTFCPLMTNRDRYLVCYGGRGSGKSYFVATKLIYRCLTEKFFRCILIRNTYSSIEDSSYEMIKSVIVNLGFEALFEFKLAPLEIHCRNGNSFICRGLDDPQKIKSVTDVSAAWWEEDLVDQNSFITVSSSIRTQKAEYLQEIFSINPEVEGDFHENWFWKKFFSDHTELSFIGSEGEGLNFTVHHSTYKDNPFLPAEFGNAMERLKQQNPYYFQIYSQGLWGNRESGSRLYKSFDVSRNVGKIDYDPMLPLWLSFDFNILPGCTALVAQSKEGRLNVIDEIQLKPPQNRTADVCKEIIRRYPLHRSGMFVTGDPAGRSEDTRSEQGYNDFLIIRKELAQYNPSLRVANAAPAVVPRINFANKLFEEATKILISEKCHLLISDLLNGPEASDGTKLKLRVRDKATGQSWERYHHHTDCLDYLICQILPGDYYTYQRGTRPFKITLGKNVSKNRPANW